MKKALFVMALFSLLIASCSTTNNFTPTSFPTSTPVIESCYVNVDNTTIQFSVTGVDVQEYCTAILNWVPEYQSLSTIESTEAIVCELEIDPNVFFRARSSSVFAYNANSFCESMKEISSSTPTP